MDHYNDTGNLHLLKLASFIDFPDYVQNFDLTKVAGEMGTHKFAWPDAGLFPTHTPGDTFLSTAYFLTKTASLSDKVTETIKENLAKSAIIHGIGADIHKLAKCLSIDKVAESHDKSYPSECYAFIGEHDGEEIKLYPVKSASDVAKAESHFEENFHNYPTEWRYVIASKLKNFARKFDTNLKSKKVKEYANDDFQVDEAGIQKLAHAIVERVKYCKDDESSQIYARMVDALYKYAFDGSFNPCGVIDLVRKADYITGLSKLQKRGFFPDPESVIYHPEESVIGRVLDLGGEIFTEADLSNTPRDNYIAALGEDFATQISDDSNKIDIETIFEIAPTLPLPDKKILASYIQRTADGTAKAASKPITKEARWSLYKQSTLPLGEEPKIDPKAPAKPKRGIAGRVGRTAGIAGLAGLAGLGVGLGIGEARRPKGLQWH